MGCKFKSVAFFVVACFVIPVSLSHGGLDYGTWFNSGVNVPYSGHSVYPNQVKLDWSAGTYGHGGGGGEFRVTSVTNPGQDITYKDAENTDRFFKTFCVEEGEHVSLNTAYDVSLDQAAYYGANVGSGPNGDYLNVSTRVIYGSYYDGTLDNKVSGFLYNDTASADALQQAIWAMEDTSRTLTGTALALYNYGMAHASDSIGTYYTAHVEVMNLWIPQTPDTGIDSTNTAAQSQLVWIPDSPGGGGQSPLAVPEPASLALWAIGMVVGAAYGRRSRSLAA